MTATTISKAILGDLQTVLEAGYVPSIETVGGGNSHTTTKITFTIADESTYYATLREFSVRRTSSYAGKFVDYNLDGVCGYDYETYSHIDGCIKAAQKWVAENPAKKAEAATGVNRV